MPIPSPTSTVYRVDFRAPDIIFQEGFQPRGNNMNIIDHLSGRSTYGQHASFTHNSGLISTAGIRNAAIRIGYSNAQAWQMHNTGTPPTMYLYEIRGTNNMYNARAPMENYMEMYAGNTGQYRFWASRIANDAETEEWVAAGAIEPEQISRAYSLTFAARGEVPTVSEAPVATNSAFVQTSSTTSAEVYPVADGDNVTPWYMPGGRLMQRIPTAFACCFTSNEDLNKKANLNAREMICDGFKPIELESVKYDHYIKLINHHDEL